MIETPINRRSFFRQVGAASLGLGVLGSGTPLRGAQAPSNLVRVAVMGVNGRGTELAKSFATAPGTEISHICDVDARVVERAVSGLSAQKRPPRGEADFRRVLDDPEVDALVIAAPDHWHTPAAILAIDAGKHVYVEKPCGHNPREGELLVEAWRRSDRVVQMGNQQRSAPESIEAIQAIRDGIIGRPYLGRCWYANRRESIGQGTVATVPDWLDYELWQGPAPRTPYRDNVIHYNWHWFWRWGTGEICNNGTHEIDICRWALGVDHPVRVTSAGGRYHFDDDWEAYDTQIASFDFEGGKTITWEGRSCNGRPVEGRGRGAAIHGEKGTVIIDRSGYVVYDHDNNEIHRRMREKTDSALDVRGGGGLTDLHIVNFLETIRGNEKAHAPIDEGAKSTLLCHLGNIAQRTDRSLTCDPQTGRVLDNEEALGLWGREYEEGWEPSV
jgi:predicted dehydrogenase